MQKRFPKNFIQEDHIETKQMPYSMQMRLFQKRNKQVFLCNYQKIKEFSLKYENLSRQVDIILKHLKCELFKGLSIKYEVFQITLKYLLQNIVKSSIRKEKQMSKFIIQGLIKQLDKLNIILQQQQAISKCKKLAIQRVIFPFQQITNRYDQTKGKIVKDKNVSLPSLSTIQDKADKKPRQPFKNLIKFISVQMDQSSTEGYFDNQKVQMTEKLLTNYKALDMQANYMFEIHKTLMVADNVIDQLINYQKNGLFTSYNRRVFFTQPLDQVQQQISKSRKYVTSIQNMLIIQKIKICQVIKKIREPQLDLNKKVKRRQKQQNNENLIIQ